LVLGRLLLAGVWWFLSSASRRSDLVLSGESKPAVTEVILIPFSLLNGFAALFLVPFLVGVVVQFALSNAYDGTVKKRV
jgi:hypothetical protein